MDVYGLIRAITVFAAAVFFALVVNFWRDDRVFSGVELFLSVVVTGLIWIVLVVLVILVDNSSELTRVSEEYAAARRYPIDDEQADFANSTAPVSPDSTPPASPDSTPPASPDSTPLVSPDSTPPVSPDSTPLVSPDSTPLVSPNPSPPIARANAFHVDGGVGVGNLIPLVGLIPGGELREA